MMRDYTEHKKKGGYDCIVYDQYDHNNYHDYHHN